MGATTGQASITVNENEEARLHLREFSGNTTLHGARYLAEKSIFRRFVWFVALGAAFGFCGRQIYQTLHAFYGRPFTTSMTRERAPDLVFPAVTVCNMNMFSKSQFVKMLTKHPEFENASEYLLKSFTEILISRLTKRELKHKNLGLEKLLNTTDFYHTRFVENMRDTSHAIDGILSLEWLKPCRWRRTDCFAANFTSLMNLRMGQCFTFNSGKQGHPLLKSTLAGPTNGLRLMLNVEEQDHVSNFYSLPSGFKVLIHDQNEYPLIEEFGFAVQPGTHTYVAVRKKMIKNLESPYKTECWSKPLAFIEALNYNYSVNACIKQCLHDYVIQRCQCQPLFNITPGMKLCSMKEVFNCIYPTTYGDVSENVSTCSSKCPESCEYTKYDTQLSYATAISNAFTRAGLFYTMGRDTVRAVLKLFGISIDDVHKIGSDRTPLVLEIQKLVRNNFVSLDIYFEELAYDVIEQKPAFDFWALLGTIGGHLGLFLGMSLLTVLEFVDFFVVLLSKGVRRNRVKEASEMSPAKREGKDSFSLDIKEAWEH